MKDDFKSVLEESKSAQIQDSDIHKLKNPSTPELNTKPEDYFVAEIEDSTNIDLVPLNIDKNLTSIYKSTRHSKLERNKEGSKHSFFCTKIIHKKSWKRRLFNFAVVLVLGVITGSLLGNWYKDYTEGLVNVDYPESAQPYLDNTDEVLAYALGLKNPSTSEKQNFSTLLKANDKTPLNFSASQNFILASYKASLASTFMTVGNGGVVANAVGLSIPQTVYSIRAYDGKTYQLSSQSKGMQPVAMVAIHDKDSANVKLVYGTNHDNDIGADWTGKVENYTVDKFIDKNGSLPDIISPYVVSTKTIQNESDVEIEYTTLNEKNVYAYTITLDPILGAIRYHKQVSLTSGLGADPKFTGIKITVYLDEDWNFVRTSIEESYNVKYMGALASCSGTLDVDYYFNEEVTMPYSA